MDNKDFFSVSNDALGFPIIESYNERMCSVKGNAFLMFRRKRIGTKKILERDAKFLVVYFNFLERINTSFDEITKSNFDEFISFLKSSKSLNGNQSKIRLSEIQKCVDLLKEFYKFCVNLAFIENSFKERFKKVSTYVNFNNVISIEEAMSVLSNMDTLRDRLIFSFAYCVGLDVSDILRITIGDVIAYERRGKLKINTGNENKIIDVNVPKWLMEQTKRYIKVERAETFNIQQENVFIQTSDDCKNNYLTYAVVQNKFKSASKLAKIDFDLDTLKQSFFYNLVNNLENNFLVIERVVSEG